MTARAGVLENEQLHVSVARDGTVRLRDRISGERYDGLLRLESGGDIGDTYTHASPPRDRLLAIDGRVRMRTLAQGPLVGALEIRDGYGGETAR